MQATSEVTSSSKQSKNGAAPRGRLNIYESDQYIKWMASKRVPTPRETIKIRRLPAKGHTLKLTAEVVRVAEGEDGRQGLVTVCIPGYPIPISLAESYLRDAEA